MYTIAEAKEAIKNGIRGYLLKDKKGEYVLKEVSRLPFYMEGAPGIGKTEIVSQIAKELHIGYVSFSLVHHTRNSLLGLPVIKDLENGGKYTCYTMSEILAKVSEAVEAGVKEGILLLDEFPCMSETILPTMLSFLQTKNIGSYTLPEGWVIVLCGNPPIYNKTARTFDAAILDRLRKIEVEFQPKVFLEYGKEAGIHEAILEYLESHLQNVYYYKQDKKQFELVTCRGWENLSHMIKTYEALGQRIDEKSIGQYIKCESIAADFNSFYKEYNSGWNRTMVEEILAGKKVQKYGAMCKKMDYKSKRNLIEYAIGMVGKEYGDVEHYAECLSTAKDLLGEMKEVRAEEVKKKNERKVFGTEIETLLTYLSMDEIDVSSGLRQEVIERFKEWEEESDHIFDLLDSEDDWEEECAVYEVLINKFTGWMETFERELKNTIEEASNKIEHFLCFIEKIDTENALLENCFVLINQNASLLRALSECPSKVYVDICARRYAVKAS